MIKAVIFDMGGVVLNAKVEQAYEILANKLGIPKSEFDNIKDKYIKDAQKGSINTADLLANISSELKISSAANLEELWKQAYTQTMSINEEVMRLVRNLDKAGYLTALITNTIEIHSEINKKRGIYAQFDQVILSNEVRMLKPQRGIYTLMLKKLNLTPNNCVCVDYKEEHLIAAKELGFHTILFESPSQLQQELRKLGAN